MGQRDVEILSLGRDGQLLGVLHGAERTHVVQTVAEFEEDDVGVVAHGEQDFAIVLGLLGLGGGHEEDILDLGDTVDNGCNTVAEDGADLVEGDVGVLNHVVQQGTNHSNGAETDLLDSDESNSKRMEDVRLARFTAGAGMGLLGQREGTEYLVLLFLGEWGVFAACRKQFFVFGLNFLFFASLVNHIHLVLSINVFKVTIRMKRRWKGLR